MSKTTNLATILFLLFHLIDLLARLHRSTESSARMPNNADYESARKRPKTPHTEKTSTPEPKEYTQKQYELCQKIKRCKDYYEMLGISKDATASEVKKSYKKLALQLHPDKNHAPGAVEAFKALGNAAAVLSDVEKRKNYDLYGADGAKDHRHHYHANHEYEHAYRNSYESEYTAEELFNMFFGNGFPQQRQQQRRFNTRSENVRITIFNFMSRLMGLRRANNIIYKFICSIIIIRSSNRAWRLALS